MLRECITISVRYNAVMKIKRFLELYNIFGADVAFSALLASRFWKANSLKHKCILRYLKEKYSGFIADYRDKMSTASPRDEVPAIWTMWWQGTDNLPDVVQLCLSSMRKYCGIHPIKILTRENFSDYVNLPEHVLRKVNEGKITITHLSDLARFYLLYHHGGLWLDSTVFITNGIPDFVFDSEYYTVKRPLTPRNRNVAQDMWTNFLHASRAGNVLCGFVLDFFLEYWKTQDKLIDYFLIDYAIKTAYDELPQCRKILDDVPLVNYDLYGLERMMNHEWRPELWERISASTHFSKLAWRKGGRMRTFSGKETIYAHLLAEIKGGSRQ